MPLLQSHPAAGARIPTSGRALTLFAVSSVAECLGNPLRKSRIRPIATDEHTPASESTTEGIPQCATPQEIPTTTQQGNRQAESLPALIRPSKNHSAKPTIRRESTRPGISAPSPTGIRGQYGAGDQVVAIWTTLSWLWRGYSLALYRGCVATVWVSMGIMLVFYVLYLLVFWRSARSTNPDHWMVHISGYPERQRAFRLRLFEPIHSTAVVQKRMLIPWRDAAMLSIRAYLKLGLGTRYPNTQPLKTLIYFEWALGIFMLIHFILAMKNNLPFILPFLGVVN